MSDSSFWDKVVTFAAQIDHCNYYNVLGIDPRADQQMIRAKFYALAPQLHPDRHARERDPRRVHAITLFYARLREAYGVLSDSHLRGEYDKILAAEGTLRYSPSQATHAKPSRPTNHKARRFFELGQDRLRQGDRRGAVMQFQMALQLEPDSELIQQALADLEEKPAATKPTAPPPSRPAPAERAPTPTKSAGHGRAVASRFAALVDKGPVADTVGVDFGTSYSSISVGIGDKLYVVPDPYGRTLHPSVVHYQDSGLALCGWDAREQLVRSPRETIGSPKRLIGRAYSDPSIGGLLQAASFRTSSGPNDTILVDVRNKKYAIAQVCAEMVSSIRNMAEKQLHTRIKRAVFTVPVTFGDKERAALDRVANLAGLEVAAYLEEPVAAAIAYGFGKGKNEIVAVYDFGGGTFDFTVLDLSGYSFQILARAGDSWLGGDDFDLALANAVADAIWRQTKVELRNRAVEWQRLLFACETTKRQLSEADAAPIIVERLIENPQPVNLRQKITRETLETLCAPLFERSLEICRTALSRAAMDPEDVQQVVISGGVSRIPFIRDGLGKFFKRDITALVNPDEAISVGAGFRAAQLSKVPLSGVGTV